MEWVSVRIGSPLAPIMVVAYEADDIASVKAVIAAKSDLIVHVVQDVEHRGGRRGVWVRRIIHGHHHVRRRQGWW